MYFSVREQLKDLTKQYDKSENDLKALQSVGQIVGEVLKQLTEEKCKCSGIFPLFYLSRHVTVTKKLSTVFCFPKLPVMRHVLLYELSATFLPLL